MEKDIGTNHLKYNQKSWNNSRQIIPQSDKSRQNLYKGLIQRVSIDPDSLNKYDIMQLHGVIGNQAVRHLIQKDSTNLSDTASLILEDSAANLSNGQMKKSEFLDKLYRTVYNVGVEIYKGSNLTVEGCPYIAYWFDHYRDQESSIIERAIRKYVSASSMVLTVDELIDAVCERAGEGFENQVRTGVITELPDDVPDEAGKKIIPSPEMIIQGKFIEGESAQIGANVIQRGCCLGGGVHAPVTIDVPMYGCETRNDGHTTLRTGGFAGCVGIILLGPGNTRTLAHIYSGHIQNANAWNNLGTFQALAGNAQTAHIYHWLSSWYQGDGGYGDQFIADFGLNGLNIVIHRTNPNPLSVDPHGNVTP